MRREGNYDVWVMKSNAWIGGGQEAWRVVGLAIFVGGRFDLRKEQSD